jgi:hypothetical protein
VAARFDGVANTRITELVDPTGLYAGAKAGELRGLTVVDAPCEPPENPDLGVETPTRWSPRCWGAQGPPLTAANQSCGVASGPHMVRTMRKRASPLIILS